MVGGLGADTATIQAAGVAVINYDPLAVGAEGTPRNNKQGAFYSIYGSSSSTAVAAGMARGRRPPPRRSRDHRVESPAPPRV